jgi:hypothetical protein
MNSGALCVPQINVMSPMHGVLCVGRWRLGHHHALLERMLVAWNEIPHVLALILCTSLKLQYFTSSNIACPKIAVLLHYMVDGPIGIGSLVTCPLFGTALGRFQVRHSVFYRYLLVRFVLYCILLMAFYTWRIIMKPAVCTCCKCLR